ncbi:MAG: carboxylating nicotinate-nucleotide diphosphorylase [Chitinophagaceae bacterium]|nr:carboxylating nicotinate-nucleotide diphosphorylase [Chitinophagaceae bacterium]
MTTFNESLGILIQNALQEDVGDGDHSALCCIPPHTEGKAQLIIKEDGIIAGIQVAEKILQVVQPDAQFTPFLQDGDDMHSGTVGFEVKARIHTILKCERLLLNCMQRMSGIATLTRKYTDRLKGHHTRLLDTRKTTPNFRLLEKEAVRIGGGENHRMGLYDMIMLKDNHIDYCGGIEKALGKAYDYVQNKKPGLKIEIETRSLDDVKRVIAFGKADRIMLDNFTPEQISAALELIAGRFETEASGGITLENLVDYAQTGVDFVSAGAVIHHAVSKDLSLKAVLA